MSDPVPVSIGRGSNKARHGQGGLASFINAYVEDLGESGKTGFSAVAINGWQAFATLTGGGGVRAMLPVDARLLTVAGRLLFSVSAGAIVTQIGGIPSDGLVTMAHNRKTPNKQTAIVCDGLWFLEEGGTLTQGSDTDLPPPIAVVESDGYFIFLISDGRWFIAGPNEGASIDPLDFVEAESSSDGNVMAAVRGRTVLIFGERSTEFWDPNASEDFPYSRTAAITVGCYAAGSVANLLMTQGGTARDAVIFAGTDKTGAYAGIMAMEGYQPQVISTPEVDRLIRDEPDKNAIRCMAWVEDAHSFYCISGTSFSKCWDGKTGEWHDRKSAGSERWNGQCVAQFAGMTIFGHVTANTLHRSLPTIYAEGSDRIVWQLQPPVIHMYPKGFKIEELQLDMITGVGRNESDITEKVALNFAEPDGSTNIVDSNRGGSAHVWAASGGAVITAGNFVLDGTGDFGSTPDHADFSMGFLDWEIVCQFECSATGGAFRIIAGKTIIGSGGNNADRSFIILRNTSNFISATAYVGSSSFAVTGTTQFTDALNTGWHTLKFRRVGNTLQLLIDNVQEGGDVSITGSVNDTNGPLSVGRSGDESFGADWQGRIGSFRLNIGDASDDTDPELVIDYSKDGGDSWAAARRASIGAQAQRKTRVKERFLGRFDHNGVTFRLTCSANVIKGLQQMALRATPLRT